MMVLGTGLLAVVLPACAAPATLGTTAGAQEEFHHTYAVAAHGRISLENINGDVHIRAWDRSEVRVDAVKRASSPERLEEAQIVVDAGPDTVAIRTRYDQAGSSGKPASVEYTVTVPRGASLEEVKLINGALDIEGVAGNVKASSVNGTVRARQLAGDAQLSTVNGELEAAFNRLDSSRVVSMHSVNGSIVLSIPFDARAEFQASNVTGGIDNDFGLPVDRGRVVGSHLKAVLKGGGTRIRLRNVNGGIHIVPTVNGRRMRLT
jgi:DUF4097 and DUF4098 domain-containing protein YvlB